MTTVLYTPLYTEHTVKVLSFPVFLTSLPFVQNTKPEAHHRLGLNPTLISSHHVEFWGKGGEIGFVQFTVSLCSFPASKAESITSFNIICTLLVIKTGIVTMVDYVLLLGLRNFTKMIIVKNIAFLI